MVNTQRKADVEAGCPTFSRSHARGDRLVKTEFNGDREESKSHGAHRIGAMAGPEEKIGDLERYKLRHRRVALSGAEKAYVQSTSTRRSSRSSEFEVLSTRGQPRVVTP